MIDTASAEKRGEKDKHVSFIGATFEIIVQISYLSLSYIHIPFESTLYLLYMNLFHDSIVFLQIVANFAKVFSFDFTYLSTTCILS